MNRRTKILIYDLLLLAIVVGGIVYIATPRKQHASELENNQKVDSVIVDSIVSLPKSDTAVIVVDSIVERSVASHVVSDDSVLHATEPVVDSLAFEVTEDSMKIDLGSVGEIASQEYGEMKNVAKEDFIFEPIELPEVSHKVVLKYQRVETPSLFVPKGQWMFGGSLQYDDHENVNYKFLVIEGWKGNGYTVSGDVYVGYAIKDNMVLGVRGGYGRTLLNMDNLDIKLGDDLNFNIHDAHNIRQTWSGAFFMRNFFSIMKSRQFGLFNDTQIALAGGHGKMITGVGETLEGTFESFFDASIGISPGIMVFIQNFAAIELSVGLIGFNTRVTKQITNQVYEGSRRTSGMKFGVDIFSVKLGATIYINSRNFKQR
ncbi:MAG: hypothetical protein RR141_00395 [Rikenellaceae bacterium]